MKNKQVEVHGQPVYSHYFQSDCSPKLPERQIKVTKINKKKQEYLTAVQDALALEESDVSSVKSRTVQEVRINLLHCPRNFRVNAEFFKMNMLNPFSFFF